MYLDDPKFGFGQFCGLVENRVGDAELANVMKQRCSAKQLHAVRGKPQHVSDCDSSVHDSD